MTAGHGPPRPIRACTRARVRTPQERNAVLDQQLTAIARQGAESRSAEPMPRSLVTGKPVNRVLHVLSLFLRSM